MFRGYQGMKEVSVTKEDFRLIMEICQKQPWIASKVDKVETLIFSECNKKEQQKLLLDLISRFEHLSHARYIECLRKLGSEIITESDLLDDNTLIVAMAADSGADSSQYVIVGLRTIMEELGWEKHRFVNAFGKTYQEYKKSNAHKNIILVDEFVGSGQTVSSRVKELKRVFDEKEVSGYSIRVKVLASTEIAIEKLTADGISITSQIKIKKGISDYYEPSEIHDKINLMLELESNLIETIDDKDMPSLGYGKCESLYCRDDGNVPNNVFPIFWWPQLKDGSRRNRLLIRAMGDL